MQTYVVHFKKYHPEKTYPFNRCLWAPELSIVVLWASKVHKLAQKAETTTLRRPKKSTFLFWQSIHPYLQIMRNVTLKQSMWTQSEPKKRSMDVEHWSLQNLPII